LALKCKSANNFRTKFSQDPLYRFGRTARMTSHILRSFYAHKRHFSLINFFFCNAFIKYYYCRTVWWDF